MTMAFTGRSRDLHIMAGIVSLYDLYLARKTPLLVRDMLPETKKCSACWDMGGNFHLTWLSSDSLYLP